MGIFLSEYYPPFCYYIYVNNNKFVVYNIYVTISYLKMKLNLISNIKWYLAWISFLAALGFGVAGMIIQPPGEIHSSVLIFVGQLLVFVCTLLGLSMRTNPLTGDIETEKKHEE